MSSNPPGTPPMSAANDAPPNDPKVREIRAAIERTCVAWHAPQRHDLDAYAIALLAAARADYRRRVDEIPGWAYEAGKGVFLFRADVLALFDPPTPETPR